MHLQGTKQELPALTGIRFLAALTVVIAHGMVLVVQFSNTPRFIGEIRNFSGLGMSLFFVLSGFVIHYNYRESVTKPYGIYNFFIARFARLYPLFISVFVAELVYAFVRHRIPPFGFDLRALPYYLTLTQTWWYAVFKDHSLIYQFGEVAQVLGRSALRRGFTSHTWVSCSACANSINLGRRLRPSLVGVSWP